MDYKVKVSNYMKFLVIANIHDVVQFFMDCPYFCYFDTDVKSHLLCFYQSEELTFGAMEMK